jgi:hypothetical protein
VGRPARADDAEDHEHQAQGGDHLAEPEPATGALVGRERDGGQVEHEVGDDGAEHPTDDLSGDEHGCAGRGDGTEGPLDERDDGIEGRRDRLQAGVSGGEALSCNAGADDGGDEERRAD